MSRWGPLPDGMGVDARRLAVHLRRMKDRSGLGVPAIAARTARGTEEWMRYLGGQALPPLDAVEVLGQLSGADQGRLTALWELAERSWQDSAAGSGTGVQSDPDPLDPLGPPGPPAPRGGRRRGLLLAVGGGLAAAAVALLVVAGLGREPLDGPVVPASSGTGSGAVSPAGPQGASTARPAGGSGDGIASPAAGRTGTPAEVRDATTGPATGPGAGTTATTPAAGRSGTPGEGTPSATPSGGRTASGSPSATASAVCVGAIVLDVCLGE